MTINQNEKYDKRLQTYQRIRDRCMLNDCTWIFAILLCIIWNCLVIFVMFASRKKRSAMTKDVIQPAVGEELKWGRYIPDPPSSIYSATTLGNRSGLLIPSSTLTREKHSEFYYNCSIPSIATSPTGDYYYSSSYSPVESKGDYSYYSLDHKTTSAYDYFTRRDYDRKYPSSYYHGGGNNQKEEDRRSSSSSSSTSPYSTRQLLTVSTLYHGSSSLPLSEKEPESATIITTPLYNKFSSSNKFNDTFSFGLGSCNNHYT